MNEVVYEEDQTVNEAIEAQKAEADDKLAIPEKFQGKSVEDVIAAYQELESRLGKNTPEQLNINKSVDDNQPTSSDGFKFVIGGQDLTGFAKNYEANGQLNDEDYNGLAELGYSRDMVDTWIAGQKARVQESQDLTAQNEKEIKDYVGGEAEFEKLRTWAGANLQPADLEVYEMALASKDMNFIKLALGEIKVKYNDTVGKDPSKRVVGESGSGSDIFRSKAEMIEAMRNPKYNVDPAYRQDVINKIGRSGLFKKVA